MAARPRLAREAALFETSACLFGPYRDNDPRLVRGDSSPRPDFFAAPTLIREGTKLTVKGPSQLVGPLSFDSVEGIDWLHFVLDNRFIERGEVKTENQTVRCTPGESVELRLMYTAHQSAPPWQLWHLRERGHTGEGFVDRARWSHEPAREQLAQSSTSRVARFVCPSIAAGDVLALVTDSGHPDFVHVHLVAFTR